MNAEDAVETIAHVPRRRRFTTAEAKAIIKEVKKQKPDQVLWMCADGTIRAPEDLPLKPRRRYASRSKYPKAKDEDE